RRVRELVPEHPRRAAPQLGPDPDRHQRRPATADDPLAVSDNSVRAVDRRTGRGTAADRLRTRIGRRLAAGHNQRRQPGPGARPGRPEVVGVSVAGAGGTGPAETRFAEALPRVAISGGRRGQRRGLAATGGVARAPAHDRRLSRRAERCDEWFTRPKRQRGKQTGCEIRRKGSATTPRTLSRSRLPDRPPRATRARARRATRCPRLIRT